MIVLNTDQAVKDLLDKRSNIYSSRPDMYLGQIVSGGLRVLLMVSKKVLDMNHVNADSGSILILFSKYPINVNRVAGIRRHVADDS